MARPSDRPRSTLLRALLPLVLFLPAGPLRAQGSNEPAAQEESEVAPAPAPKKRPPPRKPKPKAPPPVSAEPKPAPAVPPPTPAVARPAPVPMPAANLPGLTVLCEAKAARYEGPKAFALWVTRTGLVVAENPLRPLTPETTRVLQVVIAGKVATAYGPDLFALRRGGSPRSVEAMLGAPVRWDAVSTALPDTLNIVSETGQTLAELGFRECGEAPAAKAAPVSAEVRPKARAKVRTGAVGPEGGGKAPAIKTPPGLSLPQGAIE